MTDYNFDKTQAKNQYNVEVQPLDWSAEGMPRVQTYHGLGVLVNNKLLGRVNSWSPQIFQRNAEHVTELNPHTFGKPVEVVPGGSSGYTASLSRSEMWDDELEISCGFDEVFTDLMDQRRPFSISEVLFKGTDLYRSWKYPGCWFTDKNNDGFDSEGGMPTIKISASIIFCGRIKIL